MSKNTELNERGNHDAEFTQGVGGWAELTVHLTEKSDTARYDVTPPPGKVIPVIFLPGVMGSNLRLSKQRQKELGLADNRSWRPDDMMGLGGIYDYATGNDLNGWFKNATPAQRQLNLDPYETEVDYYHYTQSNDRFDPNGNETITSDARHQNVPDSLGPIPPLLGVRFMHRPNASKPGKKSADKRASPAQLARWRGWSEVLFAGAYGNVLKNAEQYLNNMMVKGQLHGMWKPLLKDPREMGASSGSPLSESDIKKVSECWYPVHALGYNFLKSNGISAKVIAERIQGLVTGYQKRNFKCNEVIIVTHSMGGLVGRALLHPQYGNLQNDKTVKVLGIYHSAMPAMGAAASYRRMRFGFLEKSGVKAESLAQVIAIDGEHATAMLANAPGPLELLPGAAYGKEWLKIVDGSGAVVWSWPRGDQTALDCIYLKNETAWWRLINPNWVNPGNLSHERGGGMANVRDRLRAASKFVKTVESTFHSTNTYSSYCDSPKRSCFGEVVFKIEGQVWDARKTDLPSQETWHLVSDDAKGTLRVKAGAQLLTLILQPGSASGDETVPSFRSAKQVPGVKFVHGKNDKGYEHQDSFSDQKVIESMLYSIVQIAKTAAWK